MPAPSGPHSGLRVPVRNVRVSPTFSVAHKNCPTRCVKAANLVCREAQLKTKQCFEINVYINRSQLVTNCRLLFGNGISLESENF
jgi:hypothetical protein